MLFNSMPTNIIEYYGNSIHQIWNNLTASGQANRHRFNTVHKPLLWLDYRFSNKGVGCTTINVSFWFSFVDCVLVYRYAYVFVRLCLDVHVVHVVLLRIRTWQLLCSQQHPLGGTPAHSGTTSAMTDVVIVYKTILLYPQSKGKLVVFGWVGAQTQFPQKTLHFNYISLHITSSFQSIITAILWGVMHNLLQ